MCMYLQLPCMHGVAPGPRCPRRDAPRAQGSSCEPWPVAEQLHARHAQARGGPPDGGGGPGTRGSAERAGHGLGGARARCRARRARRAADATRRRVIVVDCAAVVDALTAPTGTEELRQRLAREELHAPALVDFEFVSALRGLTLAARLSAARAQDALTDFEDLPLHRWEAGDALRRRAYALRDSLSAYDAAYIAL